jgi:hypothetical protein
LPSFQEAFSPHGFRSRLEILLMHQFPRPTPFCGFGDTRIVLTNALRDVLAESGVLVACGRALEDVNGEHGKANGAPMSEPDSGGLL